MAAFSRDRLRWTESRTNKRQKIILSMLSLDSKERTENQNSRRKILFLFRHLNYYWTWIIKITCLRPLNQELRNLECCFSNGPIPASFYLLLSFFHYNFNITNWKKHRVLGIRTLMAFTGFINAHGPLPQPIACSIPGVLIDQVMLFLFLKCEKLLFRSNFN